MDIENVLENVDFDGIFKDVNDFIDEICKLLNINQIKDLFDNDSQETADVSKFLSPIITKYLKDRISESIFGNDMNENTGSGFDMSFNGVPIEIKTTQIDNKWTGNKHSSEVDNHILISYNIKNGKIIKYACIFVNLSKTNEFTKWKFGKNSSSGFSGLNIHKDDIKNVKCIVGGLKVKTKWCCVIYKNLDLQSNQSTI